MAVGCILHPQPILKPRHYQKNARVTPEQQDLDAPGRDLPRQGAPVTTTTDNTSRTTHLLELMKKGDDAFNVRDFAAMDAIHHPDLIAHVTEMRSRFMDGPHTPKQ